MEDFHRNHIVTKSCVRVALMCVAMSESLKCFHQFAIVESGKRILS